MDHDLALLAGIALNHRGLSSAKYPSPITVYPENTKVFLKMAVEHKLRDPALQVIRSLMKDPNTSEKSGTHDPDMEKLFHKLESFRRDTLLGKAARSFLVLEAGNICRELKTRGIPAAVIKGPALSTQIFGSAVMREYYDLDLLVSPTRILEAETALAELGYFPHMISGNDIDSGGIAGKWYVLKPHHATYRNKKSPYRIELHCELFSEHCTDHTYTADKLISRSMEVDTGETKLPALIYSDHILFMMHHGARHGWSQLHWILDAAGFLSEADAHTHDKVIAGCKALGLEKELVLMINMVQSCFDLQIPACYSDIQQQWDRPVKKLVDYCMALLESPHTESIRIIESIRFYWKYLVHLYPSYRDVWRILVSPFLVRTIDIKEHPLPSVLIPLHIILRPFLVIRRRILKSSGEGMDA